MLRAFLILLAWCVAPLRADQEETRILILGDNLAYVGGWTVYVESAIRAQKGLSRAVIVNAALPGETASGLSEAGHAGGAYLRPDVHERLARALELFKPTLVLACYGGNDGLYLPADPERTRAYREGQLRLHAACVRAGAKVVHLTPPLFGADLPKVPVYDGVLDSYAQWLVAQRPAGWLVVDARPGLREAIAAAKQADPRFVFAKDHLHPGPEGHMLMATAIWSQLAPLMGWKVDVAMAEPAKWRILQQRANLLRDAWLAKIGHKHPSVPAGVPLPQAEARSATLLKEFLK
jgi:lysophospholipase L1-like esterase